ncbi:MAG: hypothetical protein P1P90_05845 [Patescibacteria group bacterium]|nr:hypothetical protein [Patescibacteria group bacterium]
MQTNQRKIFALILIIIGILAFLLGAWLLYGLLFGKPDSGLNLPGAGTDLNVNSRQIPEPQTYEAPVALEGDSNFTNTSKGTDLTEAINLASDTVARIGSGTSQNGFLGYVDAMSAGTPKFQAYLQSEQLKMNQLYPMNGDLYGVTTRSISSKVLDGENGSDQIKVLIQTQKAEDAGDRSKPTNVSYEKHEVTLIRQATGEYLIDFIKTEIVN